ncbi:MAG: CpaE family protein [Rhizobiales bacterium]|nr:CpaE family protein [Hyphomicrobiales bacterium]
MTNLAFESGASDGTASPSDPAAPVPVPVDVRPVPRISIQAFCESPEIAAAIEAAAADRRMARAHVKVHAGGLSAAAEFYQDAATPNLIIVESRQSRDRLDADLDRLAEVCDPGTKVVVIGHVNDVALYRDLTKRGISEYLVAPIDLLRVIKTVSELYVEAATSPLGRSIAFVGAKGGVGSSMVAHNVAWAIARNLQSDVVVADLDLAFGTAGLDFNQDPAQGIAEAVHSPDRLDDIFLDRLLARCSDHLSLLAAPATLDRTCDFDEGAFTQIIDVAQGGVPAVILDLPHVWTAWMKRTLLAADEVVLTVEPDLANLRNAKNMVDLLRQGRRNDSPPRLIINKTGVPKRPEIKADDFASALNLTPAAIIPFDAHLFGTAANNGQMIAETDAKSPMVEAFDALARAVTGRAEIKRQKKSALGPLLSRFRGKKSA